ncbi:hypothetical protein C8Q78DRAFT_1062155 [Trametes maxima]|nr:hypothetical protein C8Q78DRAFT_1062155 [Trametes maxima]
MVKAFVLSIFVIEMVHITLCMHSCYWYLVTNYFNPSALPTGVWSIKMLPLVTNLSIGLSQSFFARRVYLVDSRFRAFVACSLLLTLASIVLSAVGTAEAFNRPTFEEFQSATWLITSACALAVVADCLTSGILILILRTSRTGIERTDYMLDRLLQYTINTGLLTSIFNILALVFALIEPDNMIYISLSILTTKIYANSLLAVLNTRRSLGREDDTKGTQLSLIRLNAARNTTRRATGEVLWISPQSTSASTPSNAVEAELKLASYQTTTESA